MGGPKGTDNHRRVKFQLWQGTGKDAQLPTSKLQLYFPPTQIRPSHDQMIDLLARRKWTSGQIPK